MAGISLATTLDARLPDLLHGALRSADRDGAALRRPRATPEGQGPYRRVDNADTDLALPHTSRAGIPSRHRRTHPANVGLEPDIESTPAARGYFSKAPQLVRLSGTANGWSDELRHMVLQTISAGRRVGLN